ncbi:MAG: hypothetical protein KY437_04525 [Actinobacteria bacterium]|nr:hypothetical protein [Actinomycetota bacterium]
MPAAAIVTLIAVALTVLALAFYLVHVALMLRHVSFTLGTIIAGLRAIAHQTEPLEPVVAEINQDLSEVQAALDQLLDAKLGVDGAKTAKEKAATG